MIQAELKPAQCGQCSAYVFAQHIDGARVSADTSPLSLDAYRAALVAGRAVYVLRMGARGVPRCLAWDSPLVASDVPRVAAHGCNAVPRPLETPEEAPQMPVCALWQAAGWTPPATCPRRGAGDTGPQSCSTCAPPPF